MLLLASATAILSSEALGTPDDGRAPLLLAITSDACRECIDACSRDGAHWLAPARDACEAALAACEALAQGSVANGE